MSLMKYVKKIVTRIPGVMEREEFERRYQITERRLSNLCEKTTEFRDQVDITKRQGANDLEEAKRVLDCERAKYSHLPRDRERVRSLGLGLCYVPRDLRETFMITGITYSNYRTKYHLPEIE